MAATVNASTSAGVVITPDNSGVLAFQSSSATALTIDASQNATFVGTASATKLIPTGSSVTGNGLYLPAANSLGLSTNGTNAVYINSSQLVAIGTTTPNANAKTTIKASSTGEYQIQLEQSNVTDGYALRCSAADGDLTFNRYASSTFTERMRLTVGGDLQFNSGYGSVATAYACRAWVAFNGTGTVAIRASGNVSSITDFGTGDYAANFTTNMPDTNYASVGASVKSGGGPSGSNSGIVTVGEAPAVGSHGVGVLTADGTAIDRAYVYAAFFR